MPVPRPPAPPVPPQSLQESGQAMRRVVCKHMHNSLKYIPGNGLRCGLLASTYTGRDRGCESRQVVVAVVCQHRHDRWARLAGARNSPRRVVNAGSSSWGKRRRWRRRRWWGRRQRTRRWRRRRWADVAVSAAPATRTCAGVHVATAAVGAGAAILARRHYVVRRQPAVISGRCRRWGCRCWRWRPRRRRRRRDRDLRFSSRATLVESKVELHPVRHYAVPTRRKRDLH